MLFPLGYARSVPALMLPAAVALAGSGCCGGGGSDEPEATISLTNATPYFVHFLHPGGNALYIEPGDSVELEGSQQVVIVIAPGQEAKGMVEEYADCCNEGDSIVCSPITVQWNGGALVTDSPVLDCASSGGSCPYIYTGADDRLQGEALVGALNRGAAREDVVVLSGLEPAGGQYRVRIAAELDETELIDSAWLDVMDHPPGTGIAKGPDGVVRTLAATAAPLRAIGAGGDSLGHVLDAADGAHWEGRSPDRSLDGQIRDWVELTFEKPMNAHNATLLVRARNTWLLQDGYHSYVAGFGPGFPKLLRSMASQPAYGSLVSRYLRKSGMSLEVAVRHQDGWKAMSPVAPVGPAAAQTVSVPIELPDDGAKTVDVRIAVLPGAWLVDSVQVSFGSPTASVLQRLGATKAQRIQADATGPSAASLAAIAKRDGSYLRIETGDSLELSFAEPPRAPGVERTAMLRMSGYYEENDRSRAPCIRWKKLLSASLRDDGLTQHVLERLTFQREVDRHAKQAGVGRPR